MWPCICLTLKSDPQIVILFDKLATPGGDHCSLPGRLFAAYGREVCFIDGHMQFIHETEWPDFAKEQIELLVKEGFKREDAEGLYRISQD